MRLSDEVDRYKKQLLQESNSSDSAQEAKIQAYVDEVSMVGKGISFKQLQGRYGALMNLLQECDATPTTQVVQSIQQANQQLKELELRWLKRKQI
jgi:hypothetical protein